MREREDQDRVRIPYALPTYLLNSAAAEHDVSLLVCKSCLHRVVAEFETRYDLRSTLAPVGFTPSRVADHSNVPRVKLDSIREYRGSVLKPGCVASAFLSIPAS